MEEEGGNCACREQKLRYCGMAGILEAHLGLVAMDSGGNHQPAGDFLQRGSITQVYE